MILVIPQPQALNRIEATLQYPTIVGPVAEAWLADWISRHSGNISPSASNGHELVFLVPEHPDGCTAQLNVVYHFTHEDADAFDVHAEEIRAAIYVGSAVPYASADCDSSWSTSAE